MVRGSTLRPEHPNPWPWHEQPQLLDILAEILSRTWTKSENLRKVLEQGVMQLAHVCIGLELGATKDVGHSLRHGGFVGGGEDRSQFLLYLVGGCELVVVRQQLFQLGLLLFGAALPGTKEEPASASAEGPHIGASAEED